MAGLRLAVLFAGMLLVAAGQSILFAVLPPAGRGIGLGDWQIGLVITLSGAMFVVASPFWGRASDRRGRRGLIVLGMVGYAVFTALFAWALDLGLAGTLGASASLGLLIVIRLGFGATVAAAMPAAQAYVADATPPERRAAGIARLSAAFGLGTIAGPLIAAGLAGHGLVMPLYAAAAAALVAAAAIALILDRPARRDRPTGAMLRPTDPRIRRWVVLALGYFTVVAVVLQTLAFVVQDRLGLGGEATGRTVGLCLLVAGLVAVTGQVVLSRRRIPRPGLLVLAGLPAAMLGLGLLCVAGDQAWLIGAMACFGLAMGLCAPGLAAAASLQVSGDEQGAVAGMIGAAQAGGFILGPVAGAGLYQLAPLAPYLASIGLLVVLFGFLAAGIRR